MKEQQSPSSSPNCETCSSRDSSLLSELMVSELNIVSSTKSCRRYQRGESIFNTGDSPRYLFCVHHGNVKIFKTNADGREQIIRLATAGDVIGYRALLSGSVYGLNATALDDSQVCSIPRSEFFHLLSNGSNFPLRVMELLSNELHAAENLIVEIAQKTVRERLAETLLMLHGRYGVTDDGTTLNVKLTREELANLVGTVTESAIRNLSELKREGIIGMKGSKISILKHNALLLAANVDD